MAAPRQRHLWQTETARRDDSSHAAGRHPIQAGVRDPAWQASPACGSTARPQRSAWMKGGIWRASPLPGK